MAKAHERRYSGMAIAGFVCSFFMPLLGIIFSAIGLNQTKHDKNLDGRGLAMAGLIISVVSIVLIALFFVHFMGWYSIPFFSDWSAFKG